jgi:hypothetical protein
MRLLQRNRKPDVAALAEREDVEGLVAAAAFKDLLRDIEGPLLDRGTEIRAQATAALGDRSDQVRSVAGRVL